MKIDKYCLILAAVTVTLFVSALGQIEPAHDSLLIGLANPALAGIENLHVTINHPDEEPSGLAWENLKTEINKRINKAGMKVFIPEPGVMYKLPVWPELQIRVDMLKLEKSEQYVFHIQTLLAKSIYLKTNPALRQKVDVWKTEPVMQAASAENTPAKITNIVLEQTDTFITAYLDANPIHSEHVGLKGTKPPVQPQTTEQKYIASKNSKVFHKSDCIWVQRIAPKNMVYYKTRNDAVNDGKRPCKTCKP